MCPLSLHFIDFGSSFWRKRLDPPFGACCSLFFFFFDIMQLNLPLVLAFDQSCYCCEYLNCEYFLNLGPENEDHIHGKCC